jgi:hypothetical protein
MGGDEDLAWGTGIEPAAFAEAEVSVTGPAGTLFTYRTDVLHRSSQTTAERRAQIVLLADDELWGPCPLQERPDAPRPEEVTDPQPHTGWWLWDAVSGLPGASAR